jgi:hypothetical protein
MLIIIGFAMPFNQFFTVFRIIIPDVPAAGIYPDNISGTGANRLIFIRQRVQCFHREHRGSAVSNDKGI